MTITTTTIALVAQTDPAGRITSTGPVTLMTATGGTAPIIWGVVAGILPPGVNMDSGGRFTGVAQARGTALVTIRATDTAQPPNIIDAAVQVTVS